MKIRPLPNLNYDVNYPLGLELLTKLRLGSSHLNENRFNHQSIVHMQRSSGVKHYISSFIVNSITVL